MVIRLWYIFFLQNHRGPKSIMLQQLYKARVSLISLLMVVLTDVPRESVIW